MCKVFTRKLCGQKVCIHKIKIFCVNFIFFLQHWDIFTADLFSAPEHYFSACRHTSQQGDSNFQTVASPIKLALTESDLNLTNQKLWSKLCFRKKTLQDFVSVKPYSFWFSDPCKDSTVSENFFIYLAKLNSSLLASCNVFVCPLFQQQPGPRLERPGLHHLYLLHPVFPTVLLDLTNATDKVIASAGEYKWRRNYLG